MRGVVKSLVLLEVAALATFNVAARMSDRIIDGRTPRSNSVLLWWSTAAGAAFYLLAALFGVSAAVLAARFRRGSITRAIDLRTLDGLSVALPVLGLAASYAALLFWS